MTLDQMISEIDQTTDCLSASDFLEVVRVAVTRRAMTLDEDEEYSVLEQIFFRAQSEFREHLETTDKGESPCSPSS